MPGGAQRIARDREIVGPFELEQPEMRMAAHEHHLDAPCTRRRAASPAGTTAIRRATARRDSSRQRHAVEQHLPAVGTRVPLSRRSSVVLPDPFGPRMPTMPPRRRRDSSRRAGGRLAGMRSRHRPWPARLPIPTSYSERDVIGLQQRGLPQTRCGRARDSRALLRSRGRTGSARARRRRRRARCETLPPRSTTA